MNIYYPEDLYNIDHYTKNVNIFLDSKKTTYDLSPLKDAVHLRSLYIYGRNVKNLDLLYDLDLYDIRLNKCGITDNDIRFFDRYKNLDILLLDRNLITDISHFKNLNNLHTLHIHKNKITDFSVLKYLDLFEFKGDISLKDFLSITKNYKKLEYFNDTVKIGKTLQHIIKEELYDIKLEKILNSL